MTQTLKGKTLEYAKTREQFRQTGPVDHRVGIGVRQRRQSDGAVGE